MRLVINNKECIVPSSLSEITLKQRINFQREHGDLLHEMHKSIMEMEDEDEQSLELTEWLIERALRTVSFFTGFSTESLRQSEFVEQIFGIYQASIGQVLEDEQNAEIYPEYEFAWKGELWTIHVPELKNGSKMSFGEFIDSKQIVQDMLGLSKNRWECLMPLCAIFLRRPGEPYREEYIYPGADRLQMMEDLPMDIALQVGFFLSSSLSMLGRIFQSSTIPELSLEESS